MSQNFGMIVEKDFLRIRSHLENAGFTIDPKKIRQNWDQKNLINHLFKDKKNEGQNLTFILLEKIGEAVIKKSVDLRNFEKVLAEFL